MQNKETEILLSISIMVSGREETTEKCINSLKHLRETVPCELILTDTGCSPELHRWLEKQADQMITFVWCNDFAAARNVGLKASRGQWFMFMDDDEWFEDTREIEEFFQSGEYRQYLSASYIVRNYADMEGKNWQDTMIARMVKKHEGCRFISPVHESLWPVLEPVMHLNDFAHHYGYASDDPQFQQAKRERNLSLLFPAIERDKHDVRLYLQVVMEYIAMSEYEKALSYAQEGIQNCIPGKHENGNHIWALYAGEVRMLVYLDRWKDVIETGNRTLQIKELSILAQTSIYEDMLVAYSFFEKVEEGIACLRKYLKWKHYFDNHQDELFTMKTLILDTTFDDFRYRLSMWEGFYLYLLRGDAVTTERLIKREKADWWCETIQRWYGKNPVERRESWKESFEKMVLGAQESGEDCPHLLELYQALTVEEEPQEETESASAVTPEMAELERQLKKQIRILLDQNQKKEALAAINQLRGLFPQDEELEQMEREAMDDHL